MSNKNKPASTISEAFAKRKEVKKVETKETATQETKEAWIQHFGQEQIDKWKKEYGDREIIALAVRDKFAALRPPMPQDIGDYLMAIGTNGMDKAVAMIVEKLWISGDFELIENDDNFNAVFLQVNAILEDRKAEFFRI